MNAVNTLLNDNLKLPVICAPMFLVSTPKLVISACKNGVVGSFPAFNTRTQAALDEWLTTIATALEAEQVANPGACVAPFAVNLVVHPSNKRLDADFDVVRKHKVPFVITSQGNPSAITQAVHEWGGIVFHDVINVAHAKKAIKAGVDGLILVASGAGGHAGEVNPFALVREVREFWHGPIVLAGSINDGFGIRAAEVLGANYSYMGTRFIATEEAEVDPDYKAMLVTSSVDDLVFTDTFTGVKCHFLKPSIARAGVDLGDIEGKDSVDLDLGGSNAWKDMWSAGHGVSGIHSVISVKQLVTQLHEEYQRAVGTEPFPHTRSNHHIKSA
ncbi:nitronate monooxygenase [Alteromonas sp. McT4-15]|uniref:NAD(P)H-dependent flavin oxidoreductase n=1 Tax=Alteromonas sp. McT4-15 TaxID=2881256 RepID=UPI001CF8AD2B|nr:nitronate monooxygenase [Alteromonas sp. McT4-15]MCB4435614.1 nitronate monooxygenase [Alteromonas sp. McT4-15]